MKIGIIKTEAQYENYLNRMEQIFDAKEGTKEFEELDLLALVLEKYEEEKFSIPKPNPIAAIKFMMEQKGLNDNDLGKIINSRSRVSEIFQGKRKLTLSHIRSINKELNIPAEILIMDYKVKGKIVGTFPVLLPNAEKASPILTHIVGSKTTDLPIAAIGKQPLYKAKSEAVKTYLSGKKASKEAVQKRVNK